MLTVFCAFVLLLRGWTKLRAYSRIYASADSIATAERPEVALVFGAGVWPSGEPSPALYDRVFTAAELYKKGQVQKLLLSGDNRFDHHNEPEVMRKSLLQMGVPDSAMVLDYAGRRTYDSCYRAKKIFGVKQAYLITQAFHLDRALYLCRSLGIDGYGIKADQRRYGPAQRRWILREIGATFKSWVDLHLVAPPVVLGEKMPLK